MKNTKLLLVFLLLMTGLITKAQLGNGILGTVTVSTTVNTDAVRARVVSITDLGGSVDVVTAGSTGAWNPGDKVLIILMAQTTVGTQPTRNWQMADINSITGSTLNVTNFAHTNWCTTSSPTCKIQVIKVNQYDYLNINSGGKLTCSAWNGSTGGVVAFLVQNDLTLNGTGKIDVKAKGFWNANSGGQGGGPAIAPPPTPLNTTPNPGVGNDGLRTSFPFFAKGQCVSPLPGQNGGDGGTGGFQTPGFNGVSGDVPETRQSLPSSAAPKLLFLGNGGKEGRGGKGGSSGGAGSNGGNGGNAAPNSGSAGGPATAGGDGGDGGRGGGVVIVLANNIYLNSPSCIDISGTSGFPGQPFTSTTSPAFGGNGGDGGRATTCIGYGAFGIKGQRGDGASGGGGGSGGSLGSLSMRVPTGNFNTITAVNKTTYITNIIGAGAAGGIGQDPYPLAGNDGVDGCPVNLANCPTMPCTVKKYIPYKWACHEAYWVLGDMDQAVDYGSYIKFTKSGGPTFSKKNGAMISNAAADYYCLYYKCSKLLMAFEDDGNPPVAITRPECVTLNPVVVKFEQRANLYWCKLEESPCGTCDLIHRNYYNDIISGIPFLPPSPTTITTLTDASTGLQHSLGWVEFGNNGASMPRFRYEDLPMYAINGGGQLFDKAFPTDVCTKSTEEFRTDWIDLYSFYPCSCPPPGSGGGGTYGGGSGPSHEVYPQLPYIPELWDNPKKGDDGPPGDPGEGDDTYFDGDDFDMADENGMSELVGVETISAVGKLFAVSPNPTGDILSVTITGTEIIQKADIRILDITGKLVFEKQGCNISNKTLVQDISKLQSGTYFITITAKNASEVLKFVKQ